MITAQLKEVEKVTAQVKQLSLGAGGITEETDPTVPDWAKQPNKPTYTAADVGALPADTKIPSKPEDVGAMPADKKIPSTAAEVGAIPVPTTATIGQTIRVSAVDESGKPTEWEAVDFPEGGGGVLRRAGRIELAAGETCGVVEISGLNIKLPISLRAGMKNQRKQGSGITITINGKSVNSQWGGFQGTGTKAGAKVWLEDIDGKIRATSFVSVENTFDRLNFDLSADTIINSIAISTWYSESNPSQYYFEEGFWFEVWEGVYPNVG